MSNLELFAKLYATSRDNGRESVDAAMRASTALRRVFYAGREWAVVDLFTSLGHMQAVLERKDERGFCVRRTVLLSELNGEPTRKGMIPSS